MGAPGVAVGPQDAADHRETAHAGDRPPRVEALAGHHQLVRPARLSRGRGEDDVVTRRGQHLPADRHLGGVEVAGRQRHQHGRHGSDAHYRCHLEHRPESGDSVEPVADSIFSDDDGIEKLWVQAYQGEVLGEALFAGLADRIEDPVHAGKMRVLATLELRTKEAVAPALERAGIPTASDPEMLALAQALVPDSATQPWDEVMRSLEAITGQFIPLYRRIGELSPPEQDTADLLVAHEEALRDFARAELAGEGSTSLVQVNALAHMR